MPDAPTYDWTDYDDRDEYADEIREERAERAARNAPYRDCCGEHHTGSRCDG